MSRLRVSVAALVVALLTVFAAGATVLTGQHAAELVSERQVAVRAAEGVTVVLSTIRIRMSAVAEAASASQQDAGPLPDPSPEPSATTRTMARDSGQAVLDETAGGLVVKAVYDGGSQPTTVQERRDRVVGYVTAPLDLTEILRDLAPPGGGITVDGPQGRVGLPGAESGDGPSRTVLFVPDGVDEWSLTVSAPRGGTPATAWILALVIAISGAGVSGWIAVRQRGSRRSQAELLGLQETHAAVASLALVAQHTLDLAEVLPAMSTELVTTLGLRGLTVSTAASGGDRPLFTWGAAPREGPLAVGLDGVAAGESVWLRLSRGGRTAARLGVVAGRDLGRHDVSTLIAVGDVMASALINAEAFAQQQSLVDRMKAVDRLKSVFLSTASHELRTPVVAIAGYSSLLHDNWDSLGPVQARSLVDRVDRNAQRLSRMVEDLLDFARLEQGSPLSEEPVLLDLGDVVGQVIHDQRDLVQDHDIRYLPQSGVAVKGSRQALERVVLNLVGNAAKYAPAGGEIRVLVRERDELAELVVEDDGPGIAAADREQIFSRFYRGQGDEVTRTRGTGLGLAIVTEFALSMRGAVRVDESDSGGARFVVAFPLAEPPPTHDSSPSSSGPTTSVSIPGGTA